MLKGGGGDDFLTGGFGLDTIDGGGGVNTVVEVGAAGDPRRHARQRDARPRGRHDEVVTISLTGSVTGGTFTLTFKGQSTDADRAGTRTSRRSRAPSSSSPRWTPAT